MDTNSMNNLINLTTLNSQQSSMTPLVTGGKGQQLLGSSNARGSGEKRSNERPTAGSRLDGISSIVENGGVDDNISHTGLSNYDQTTLFGSPGMNKSVDGKFGTIQSYKPQGQRRNQNQQMTMNTQASSRLPNAGNSAQRQSFGGSGGGEMQQTFGSPLKSSAVRKGSVRSNSSHGSNEGRGRHSSARRTNLKSSAQRRGSFSTDQDSTERSFTYPCQAFKQFLLAVREGKIDMKDLNNSPFLIDYLTMQAQIGGGSGGATGGALRSHSRGHGSGDRSSPTKGRDLSRSNKKRGKAGNLGDSTILKNPRESIIEEDEDEHGAATHGTAPSRQSKHALNQQRNSNTSHPNSQTFGKPNQQEHSSSPMRQTQKGNQAVSNPASSSLQKHKFREDQPARRSKERVGHAEPESMDIVNQSAKKQRRGRNERSTSGDERPSLVGGGANPRDSLVNLGGQESEEDLRFDEKGRPIRSSPQKGGNDDNKKSKVRRGRGDRDSSISSSTEGPLNSSILPKPVQREDPQRQSLNAKGRRSQEGGLPQIEERHNQDDEDGTFRDYARQERDRDEEDSQIFSEGGKIPILQKNTDFNVDADYSLNAFKEHQQPKKFLKSNASPVKTSKLYKEDELRGAEPGEGRGEGHLRNIEGGLMSDELPENYEERKSSQAVNKSGMPGGDYSLLLNEQNILDRDNRPDDYNSSELLSNNNPYPGRSAAGGQGTDNLEHEDQSNYDDHNSSYVLDPSQSITAQIIKKQTPSRESRKVKSSASLTQAVPPQLQTGTSLQDSSIFGIHGAPGDQFSIREGSMTYVGAGDPVRFKEFLDSQNRYTNLESQLKGQGAGDHEEGGKGEDPSGQSRTQKSRNQQSRGNNLQSVESINERLSDTRDGGPLRKEDLEGYTSQDPNFDSANLLLRNQSSDKKHRRDRSSRKGGAASGIESSLERQPFPKSYARTQGDGQASFGVNQGSLENPDASTILYDNQSQIFPIEEHDNSYRSKAGSNRNQDRGQGVSRGEGTNKSRYNQMEEDKESEHQRSQHSLLERQSSSRYTDDYDQRASTILNQSERKRQHRRGQPSYSEAHPTGIANNQAQASRGQDRNQSNRAGGYDNTIDTLNYSSFGQRPPRDGDNEEDRYKTNYTSSNVHSRVNRGGRQSQQAKPYQSRLKELEDKLKKQIQDNPTKPLDYKLIQEINEEAARTIQNHFRNLKSEKKMRIEMHRHGNLVDRQVQTEPVTLISLAMHGRLFGSKSGAKSGASPDMDRFKKFFFAVFYTYMMMNTIMADVFKRRQPVQTENQWTQQDYVLYMQFMQQQQQQRHNPQTQEKRS